MRKVPDDVLIHLSESFGYEREDLTFLGGGHEASDGIAYRCGPEGARVLKIVTAPAYDSDALKRLEARSTFFAYLGGHGVNVVAPAPTKRAN